MTKDCSNLRPAPAAAVTLLAVLLSGVAAPALAQQAAAPAEAKPAAAKPAAVQHPEDEEDDTVSELVVVGTRDRPQPGAVVGDIQPEVQLSPAQIQSYGVSSVSDLLAELSPQLTSNRGRGGEAPVVLLNGRRISGFAEIRDIPTEAIVRVDILPEEAALAYGFSADQKVINFVLRRRFRATTVDATGGGPTDGGQVNGTAEINRLQIRGDNRINLVLKAQAASAITADERDVDPLVSTQPYDLTGNLTGATRGGQIDPALSAIVGRPVTVAGLPVSAVNGQPLTLNGLASTAGVANVSDVDPYRSLVPETKTVTGNAVLARTLPHDFRGTLTANFTASRSESLRGLPGASLTIPDANPFSPFATDTTLNRYVTAFGPLQQTTESWSGQLGGSLNRDLNKWRMSLTGSYDHSDSFTVSDVGVDISALQAAVNAGGSPFTPWDSGLIAQRGVNKARSISDGFNIQGVASGPAFDMPAGPVRTSFKVGEAASWLASDTLRLGVERDADLSRNTLSAQGSIDVPLASRKKDFLPFLGELSVNANAAVNDLSDFGTLTTVGFGMNWRPVTGLSFIVSHTRDEGAPTMAQVGGPQVVTEAARIFDYATGQTVEVRRIDGGNAALTGDERNVTKFGVTWKPIASQDLTFSANYVHSRIENPIATFPAATAEIEAAFPDRFTRDASGNLIQIDYRPVNFAQTKTSSLRWGFNYSRPWGPQPQPRRFGQGGPGGPGGFGPGGPGADGQRQGQGQGQAQGQGGQRSQGQGARPGQGGGSAATAQTERPEGTSPDTTAPSAPPGSEPRAVDSQQAQGSFGPPGGGGFGGPGGGPPGGFRGGGFGGGPGGLGGRIQFALYHTITFEDEILVRDGGPTFDLLHGSAAGNGGGQPRHEVQAQAGVSRNGLGARISANWQSATTVDAPASSPTGDLHFGDIATVDLRLFANLGANRELVAKQPFFRGSRLTLSVTNLFDADQKVTDVTGRTPSGYKADELNPTGRVVSLSFRKLFF